MRKIVSKAICYLLCFGLLIIGGCDRGSIEPTPVITPTQKLESTASTVPTVTPQPTNTPRPTRPLSFEEMKKLREEERLALSVSPTPGPEPYSIFTTQKDIDVGDVVTMGEYCHGRNPYSSFATKFPIKWLVLEKDDDKALLISLFNVDYFQFVDGQDYIDIVARGELVCWKSSTVRAWLNEGLYQWIFTEEEKSCVCESVIQTPDNPIYGTDGGEDTTDYLFLLSIEEAEKYFLTDEARKTQIVPEVDIDQYDLMPGTHTLNTTDYYDWWLRSPGAMEDYFASVGRFGDIMEEGQWSSDEEVSIRPAMWIDLNKVKEFYKGGIT